MGGKFELIDLARSDRVSSNLCVAKHILIAPFIWKSEAPCTGMAWLQMSESEAAPQQGTHRDNIASAGRQTSHANSRTDPVGAGRGTALA